MRLFIITVYTIENCVFHYTLKAEDLNRPREHAKRIVLEGYWEIMGDGTEYFHAPWRIVKVKIEERSD
jgi:hypothetical protein